MYLLVLHHRYLLYIVLNFSTGTLASKVLSSQGLVPVLINQVGMNGAQNQLQALDIFLVQANTNTILAHFAPLVCYMSIMLQMPQIKYLVTREVDKSGDQSSKSAGGEDGKNGVIDDAMEDI